VPTLASLRLRFHPECALKDHAVGDAPAEQRAERPGFALGEQPGRQVRARVADLGEGPQCRRDPPHLDGIRALAVEHLDDAVEYGRVDGEVTRGAALLGDAGREREDVR
jgi:hypothetical protein